MKKFVINFLLAILFSFAAILSIISFTIFNDNYLIKVMDKTDAYSKVTESINKELETLGIDFEVKREDVEVDLKMYARRHFDYRLVEFEDKDIMNIYNKYVLYAGKHNYKLIRYIFYVINILMIIMTGNIFLKSKKIHNINVIFILSFIILTIVYGCSYLFINVDHIVLNNIINVTNHIILAGGIILLEIGLYKTLKNKEN